MSKINDVIQRAISDAAFRTQLRSDPAKALRGFNLSPEETRALTSGDPARLTALGVDQRMSKMFTTGFASSHSSVSGGDVARGVSTASLTSSGGALSASHASTNAHGDPDAIFSGSDDPSAALVSGGDDAHASLQPNRVLGGDPDYVPASGDTSSSALISPAPEDAEAVPQFHSTGEASLGEGGTAAGPGSGDLNEIQP